MNHSTDDEPTFDHDLLDKADALIQRNRPTGTMPDADDLPMLTDVLDDDLPELTETLIVAHEAPAVPAPPAPPAPDVMLTLDLDEDATPRGQYQPLSPMPPQQVIEQAVDEALEIARQEMFDAQQIAIREAVERARTETFNEARVMNQHAIQAAHRQGREEAEINQWSAIQAAREDAVQQAASAMSERLIELDAQIAQSLNQWLARELPPLIATELAGVAERLKVQTAAHMRATLLPELSEQVSMVLESVLRPRHADEP